MTTVTKATQDIDMSHMITTHEPGTSTRPIGEIEVQPGERTLMSLGCFEHTSCPDGFSIELDPASGDDAITTQLSRHITGKNRDEFVLHIANHDESAVSVTVWQA